MREQEVKRVLRASRFSQWVERQSYQPFHLCQYKSEGTTFMEQFKKWYLSMTTLSCTFVKSQFSSFLLDWSPIQQTCIQCLLYVKYCVGLSIQRWKRPSTNYICILSIWNIIMAAQSKCFKNIALHCPVNITNQLTFIYKDFHLKVYKVVLSSRVFCDNRNVLLWFVTVANSRINF